MRVAVVAEWYPSPADPVHGIWAHRQAVAAAAHGAEVRVLALRRPVPPLTLARGLARVPPDLRALRRWARGARAALAPERRDGVEVHPVAWLGPPRPISYGSWGWWMAPPLARALDRLRREWPFELLHAHCLAPAGHAAGIWAARRPGVAFAVSAHGPDMIHLPRRAAGRHACVSALRRADVVLANSGWAQRRCRELGGESVAVEVVHLGADLIAEPAAGASPRARRDSELTLVTVAHLQARKNHEIVLRALARLDPGRRPRYLVIGDGERRGALERLTSELGLDRRVSFLGQLPNDEAVARVAGCDLFVMPGVQEPFGVAFVEAMAAGVPAIGARGEGGPEDIAAAGEGMLLVDAGDVEGLARELERLTADSESLRALGEAARATATAHFTWGRCGERTVAVYRRAIDRAVTRRGAQALSRRPPATQRDDQ
ncbi:MAG: glycosyltransferase [Solirubrobacteraceae bacterium]